MIYDPHKTHNPNFDQDDWREYQIDERVLNLVEELKAIFETGMGATISNETLSEIGFDVASKAYHAAPILQERYRPHWTALAICILAHGMFEPREHNTIFWKSRIETLPLYPPNIKFETYEYKGRFYERAVLKTDEEETAPVRKKEKSQDPQLSLFGDDF